MRVYKIDLNWVAECDRHNHLTWCGDWMSAMEALWGHIIMHHARSNP